MLIDLLNPHNYISFNVQLANIIGLHNAIYLSQVLSLYNVAVKARKTKDNYMPLNREYIKQHTTLAVNEQKEIEAILKSLGIIKLNKTQDGIIVDAEAVTTLCMSDDETLIKNVKELIRVKTKPTLKDKSESVRFSLISNITTDNEELRNAYIDWIDSVLARDGWMSATAVKSGEKYVDNACVDSQGRHNLDIALKIIEIASINAYKNMEWAVNTFNDKYASSYRQQSSIKVTTTKQLSSEVF